MHQLIVYDDVSLPSDTNNEPGAVVERDSQGNINVSSTSATKYLSTEGALFVQGKSWTAVGTLDETAVVDKADATSGAFTLTLPPAATSTNLLKTIVKVDSSGNLVTVKGNGSENINGSNTYTGLSAQWNVVRLWCDGTKWIIV